VPHLQSVLQNSLNDHGHLRLTADGEREGKLRKHLTLEGELGNHRGERTDSVSGLPYPGRRAQWEGHVEGKETKSFLGRYNHNGEKCMVAGRESRKSRKGGDPRLPQFQSSERM